MMKENEDFFKGEDTVEESAQIQETPEEEIGRLKSELEAKTRDAEDNYGKFLRASADLDNYRKRAEKERADLANYANENFISEILPAIDNFERALSHANGEGSLDSLRQGVKLTIDQMYAVLKKLGLQEVKAVGERFDPSIHHAISEEPSVDAEPGTVVREFQRGYFLKGRLLRPAMVAVAKGAESEIRH